MLTKDFLKQQLAKVQEEAQGTAMITLVEAGKVIGRIDGMASCLGQLVNIADQMEQQAAAEKAEAEAAEAAATGGEAGQGQ